MTFTPPNGAINAFPGEVIASATWNAIFTDIYADLNSFRERLTAPRTYYVRTDGSDSNNGLANTAGGAFLTISHAVVIITRTIDAAGQPITIQVGNGTYNESVDFSTPMVGAACSNQLIVRGDPTTPTNVILNGGTYGFRVVGPGPDWLIDGFKITTSSGPGIWGHANGWIRVGKVNFGSCGGVNGVQIQADQRGSVELQDDYTISAGAGFHALVNSGGYLLDANGVCTLVGTPAFSNYFVYASGGSKVGWTGGTFSGGATGNRFLSQLNSVIESGNSSPNTFFPGNVNGTTATGGQCV